MKSVATAEAEMHPQPQNAANATAKPAMEENANS
jgi:hypothetical protein